MITKKDTSMIAILFLIASIGLSTTVVKDASAFGPPSLFTVCHNGNTLHVSFTAFLSHLFHHHDDYPGSCITPPEDEDDEEEDDDQTPPEEEEQIATRSSCPGGDCIKPTLGPNNEGVNLVQNGFSCNGVTLNVEDPFKNHLELIILSLNTRLDCTFKIYENSGVENLNAVDLSLGKKHIGETVSTNEKKISWRQSFNGLQSVTFDEDTYENVNVTLDTTACRPNANDQCAVLYFTADIKSPIVGDTVVGVSGWDSKGNSFVVFFNEGLQAGTPTDIIPDTPYVIPQGDGNKSVQPDDLNLHQDQRWSDAFQKKLQEYTQLITEKYGY